MNKSPKKPIATQLPVDPEIKKVIELYFKDKEVTALFNNRDKQVSYDVVSARTLSHWEDYGLLTVTRDKDVWRRKFSLMDMLWLHIMSQLRDSYGMSLEKLKTVKESLEDKSEIYGVPMPILEVYTMLALTKRKDVALVIFPDSSAKPFLSKYVQELLKDLEMNNFIVLNLNKVLERVMPKYHWVKEQF